MWLRKILRNPTGRLAALAGRAISLEGSAKLQEYRAFREFTPPPKRDHGGRSLQRQRGGTVLSRIAIVPNKGIKIP